MMQDRSNGLVIVPALKAVLRGPGRFLLTQKFVEGACAFAEAWPGPVAVLVAVARETADHLDLVELGSADMPFSLEPLPDNEQELRDRVRRAGIVLVTTANQLLSLSRLCAQEHTPVVNTTETTLHTRKQMVDAETTNPLKRLRRKLWTTAFERRALDTLRLVSGVQCNGTPTYDAYREINPRLLLFFDTRVTRAMLAPGEAIAAKQRSILSGGPLRLAFSGRLVAIKGADHLPRVAAELRRLGVRFTMDIFGGGEQEPAIRSLVERFALADVVRLRGVAPFQRELMPYVTHNVDLFVCCHRQGDPSCTYLETMSCGTPIAGYDNEAFAGLVRLSGVGWMSAMDNPGRLAERIAVIDKDRACLAAAVQKAVQFASGHTFEATMRRRVDHLLACQQHGEARSEAKVA